MELTTETFKKLRDEQIKKHIKLDDELYDKYEKGDMPQLEYLAKYRQLNADMERELLGKLQRFNGKDAERIKDSLRKDIEREESIAKRKLEELEQMKKNGEKIKYFVYFI